MGGHGRPGMLLHGQDLLGTGGAAFCLGGFSPVLHLPAAPNFPCPGLVHRDLRPGNLPPQPTVGVPHSQD